MYMWYLRGLYSQFVKLGTEYTSNRDPPHPSPPLTTIIIIIIIITLLSYKLHTLDPTHALL